MNQEKEKGGIRGIVIGITGTFLSGKDTVADMIREDFSFKEHHTFSDQIRKEATKIGMTHERENLYILGNEIRKNFGAGELGRRVIGDIKTDRVLVTGFRNPAEIEVFKQVSAEKNLYFYLIGVDAPIRIRYERSLQRGRAEEDKKSFESFKKIDDNELYGGETKQENEMFISKCLEMSDFLIMNDSSFENLKEKTIEIVNQILN